MADEHAGDAETEHHEADADDRETDVPGDAQYLRVVLLAEAHQGPADELPELRGDHHRRQQVEVRLE